MFQPISRTSDIFIVCWSNYLKKYSTPFLLYTRDLETAVTKRIEFSEKKLKISRGAYCCALEYKFCVGYKV